METAPNPDKAKAAKYLVCIDNREESRIALRLACMKARMRGSSVDLLHVIIPADFQTLGGIAERMREERRAEGEQLLKTLSEEANRYGIVPSLLLREGSVGDEILAATRDNPDINIIVIGIAQQSSGRGKLAAWLAGQLGSKLFVPLLMVPGNLTDQQLQALV
jgi:nucleotide-binding universal stress UspA family protein